MSDYHAGAETVPTEPVSKRRRVDNNSVAATARSGSADRDDADAGTMQAASHSIRRGRTPTRSRSRSGRRDRSSDTACQSSPPGSQSPTSQRRPRSRSRRHSRSQSYSQSASRSRSRRRRSSRGGTSFRSDSRSTSRSRSRCRYRCRSSSDSDRRRRGFPASASSSPPPPEQAAHKRLVPHFRPRLILRGHAGAVSQVRVSPSGDFLASCSSDGTCKIWDTATGQHLDTLVGHLAGVSCVAWSPDGDTLATGSDDKSIRLWDRVTGGPAHAARASTTGGFEDKKEERQPAANAKAARTKGRGGVYAGAAVSSGLTRGGRTGRGPLLGHHNYVTCLAFSPKGNMLASGSYDEAVFLWDVRAGRLMRSLPAHSDPVSGIHFVKDGTLVVSCSTDGLVRLWDTSTGQCLRTLVHEDNPAVTSVCFSPNGRFVLAWSLDHSIRMWDYVSGTVKKTYQGHQNSGFCIGGCFGTLTDDARLGSQRQAYIASASEDGAVLLWDVMSKEVVQRVKTSHQGVCFWVDVHGDTLVTSGQDGTIRVFHDMRAKKSSKSGLANVTAMCDNEHGHEKRKDHEEGGAESGQELEEVDLIQTEEVAAA